MVNILLFIMPFFIYVAIKGIIVSFSFNIHLSPFFLSTFSTLNCFWFVFVKYSNNFFAIRIINNICPQHSIFNFFNHKNIFRPIWSISFRKNIFICSYSNNISNFQFRIFFIIFLTRVKILLWFYINRLHFNCAMIWSVTFINDII